VLTGDCALQQRGTCHRTWQRTQVREARRARAAASPSRPECMKHERPGPTENNVWNSLEYVFHARLSLCVTLVATEAVCADLRPIWRHWNCHIAASPVKLSP
jgi:hypothetical protein